MDYTHWFNHERLLDSIAVSTSSRQVNGDIPPIELEQAYYARKHARLAEAG